jgi:hypothetical protein
MHCMHWGGDAAGACAVRRLSLRVLACLENAAESFCGLLHVVFCV